MVRTWAHVAQVGRLPLLTQMMLYSLLLIMIHCTGTGWPGNKLENRALRAWPASPFRIPRQCRPSSLFPVWLPQARHEMSVAQTCSCLQRSLRALPSPPSTLCPDWVPSQRMGRRNQDAPWCLHIMAGGLCLTTLPQRRQAPGLPAPLRLQRVSSAKMTHCDAVRERGQEQRGGTRQLDREPRLPKDGTKSPGAEPSLPGHRVEGFWGGRVHPLGPWPGACLSSGCLLVCVGKGPADVPSKPQGC